MPIKGPSTEDLNKIHTEINQIANQRMLLTTVAVTVFGFIVGWLLDRAPDSQKTGNLGGMIYMTAISSFVILFMLFFTSHILRSKLRIFSSYLRNTKKSGWEEDWKNYRATFSYSGGTVAQMWVFLVLGLILVIIPIAIAIMNNSSLEPLSGAIFLLMAFILFETLIYKMARGKWFYNEKKMDERWEELGKTLIN
jgi:hypothetical protein